MRHLERAGPPGEWARLVLQVVALATGAGGFDLALGLRVPLGLVHAAEDDADGVVQEALRVMRGAGRLGGGTDASGRDRRPR